MALLSGGKNNTAAIKSVDRTNFVATAGQTVFTLTQGYSVGDVDVFLNGIKLVDSDDYTAINGTTVILTTGTLAGDYLQVVSYNQFNAANTYTKTESDSRYMVATGTTPMSSYLRTPNYGISSYSDSASASLEANPGLGESGVGIKAFGRSVATNGGDILYTTDTRGAGGRHRFGNWNGTTFTQTMGIDPVGRMTLPYQPSFHAYGNTVTASSSYLVYPSTNFNVGGHYNTTNGRFTAPITGTYMIGWTHIGSTNNTCYRFYARVNGNNLSAGDIHLRLDTSATGSEYGTNGMYTIPWKMNAGDYFQIWFVSDDASAMHPGSASSTNDYPRFWGYLLG
jgi:hypothetical protein